MTRARMAKPTASTAAGKALACIRFITPDSVSHPQQAAVTAADMPIKCSTFSHYKHPISEWVLLVLALQVLEE